jgi:hypothetical protein
MRKSCAAKTGSCDGSTKVPVKRYMLAAVAGCAAASRLGLGLAAAAEEPRRRRSLEVDARSDTFDRECIDKIRVSCNLPLTFS